MPATPSRATRRVPVPARHAARLIAAAILASLAWGVAAAEMLVVIPDVSEPYRSVLSQMVDGIRTIASVRLVLVAGDPAANNPANVSAGDERVVIALGAAAVRAAASLSARLPVVAGAIVTPTGQPAWPGISLEADPDALFAHLRRLRPGIRTVHWLYRPARSGWLLERAQAAARKHRLELVAVATDDARTAAQRYQEILGRVDSATEAMWLSQDPALLGNDSALPDILNQAWAKNIVVFSGSVQHVAHGVLFALFPDNMAMGADLARLALAHADGAPQQFEPNRGLLRAINRRTAEHLGLNPEPGDYDLVLPTL